MLVSVDALVCVGVCWFVVVCVGVIALQVMLRNWDWFCTHGCQSVR